MTFSSFSWQSLHILQYQNDQCLFLISENLFLGSISLFFKLFIFFYPLKEYFLCDISAYKQNFHNPQLKHQNNKISCLYRFSITHMHPVQTDFSNSCIEQASKESIKITCHTMVTNPGKKLSNFPPPPPPTCNSLPILRVKRWNNILPQSHSLL